ncbi:MAG: hypothetical protein N2747_05230 [Chitinophagaceae bacterium]|nr:hypothetical protein [Chitinophagaceae bacterium]
MNIPFGTFHSTHDIGFGIQGEFTDIRFRKSKKKKERALRSVFLSGLELFSGQKENVRGYPFRYLALWIFHASGGAVYALNKKWRISATAGPSLGNYSNTFRFNWSGAVSGSYAVTNRLSAVAGLILFKEPGADVLASFSLRTGYRF